MADPAPKKLNLGNNIPRAVRDFVSCRTSSLDLDLNDPSWIPELGGIKVRSTSWSDESATSHSDNAGKLTADVDTPVGDGTLVVSVAIVEGQVALQADVQGLGTMGEIAEAGIGDAVTQWGRDLNADLRGEGKKLGDITFDKTKGQLTFTKVALAPTQVGMSDPVEDSGTEVAAAGVGAGVGAASDPTEVAVAPEDPTSGTRPWLKGLIAAGTITALGAAGVFLFTNDNEIVERPESQEASSSDSSDNEEESASTGASWTAEDPSGDQMWVAAREQSGDGNACTDFLGATVTRTGDSYQVRINVREGMTPEEVMEQLDSKAILVFGLDASGAEQGWMWEWHDGQLVDGSALDANGAPDETQPAARFSFEGDEVIVDLPPTGEFTDVGILGFANPDMADPAEGPAWRDEMTVSLQ